MKVCAYFCKMNRILLDVIGLTYSNSQSGAYALIMGEKDSKLRLPIIIGEYEAQSIAIAIEGIENRRPLTHDLFKSFAENFDINITEVIINRFKEGIFYSELHCVKEGETSIIDCRTSDAIAIALRFKCPIYTYPQIIEEAGIEMEEETDNSPETQQISDTETLEDYSISELEILLQEAIEEEDYAKASVLRDIINEKKMFL